MPFDQTSTKTKPNKFRKFKRILIATTFFNKLF